MVLDHAVQEANLRHGKRLCPDWRVFSSKLDGPLEGRDLRRAAALLLLLLLYAGVRIRRLRDERRGGRSGCDQGGEIASAEALFCHEFTS